MPSPTHNVLFPFVLPAAALNAADRLVTALLTLLEAVTEIAIAGTRTPTDTGHAAIAVFFRLQSFLTTLIRISALGIRPSREPNPATAPAAPPTRSAPDPALCLPRRSGWLLAILPDIAPAIAADLGLILADPAFAILLDAEPTLNRTLAPLLRALGLTKPSRPPPQNSPPPRAHPAASIPITPKPDQPPPSPTPKPPLQTSTSPRQFHSDIATNKA